MFASGLCPYCGEPIELAIDGSIESQHYVEDCQVCCRPIEVSATVDAEGDATLVLRTGDDA
ncbi:MAG TPA: CPXCG motif-containing cysteine-rich protein [Luteimonas sp.]|nr:CPXCG motif-containing cysteine-rich protein [Luteimonas sp.]